MDETNNREAREEREEELAHESHESHEWIARDTGETPVLQLAQS